MLAWRIPLAAAPELDMLAGSAEMRYWTENYAEMVWTEGEFTLVVVLFTLRLEASRNTFRPSPRSMCRKNVGNKPDRSDM